MLQPFGPAQPLPRPSPAQHVELVQQQGRQLQQLEQRLEQRRLETERLRERSQPDPNNGSRDQPAILDERTTTAAGTGTCPHRR